MTTGFDLDDSTRRRLGTMVVDKINEYFSSLPQRAVQLPAEQRTFDYVPEPIPEQGQAPEAVLGDAFRELCDRGFHVPSANYLGLMNPTPTFIAVLAEMIVSAINPQMASVERSAAASRIEKQTIDWIGGRIGWEEFSGTFTTGGSEANTNALTLSLVRAHPEFVEHGLRSFSGPVVFYASDESHHSLDKAAGMLGLGRSAVRRIATTSGLQMDLEQLETAIQRDILKGNVPVCIVGTGGTTNTGAIDDLTGIAEIAGKYGLWFHVDGAYGAAVILSDRYRNLVRGIELADSVAIDPHKWLAMPFSAGMLLTTHPELLRTAFATEAPYLRTSRNDSIEDLFQISSQWSRRMNSLKLWMTLRVHGRQAYQTMIDNQIELAGGMGEWVQDSEHFELCAPQTLSAVAFRIRLPGASEEEIAASNLAVVDDVNSSGERWISPTTVSGRSAIRTMVISYLTTEDHLRRLQQALVKAAARTIGKREHLLAASAK